MVKNMKIGDLGPFFDAGEFWRPQGELGDWCQKEGLKQGKNWVKIGEICDGFLRVSWVVNGVWVKKRGQKIG